MPGKSGLQWSGIPVETIIDREFGRNRHVRSGLSAYAAMLADWAETGNGDALLQALLDSAGAAYRAMGQADAVLYTFGDGAANYLFDMARERVVLVWGVSRRTAPGSRDKAYHAGFPNAGKGFDKGHLWSHAQGGREGGPNYFRQARQLNQGRSNSGRLWRAIESYLAANAGLSAFIRLIYAVGNNGDKPDEVEYGLLTSTGQFRAVIFPNA